MKKKQKLFAVLGACAVLIAVGAFAFFGGNGAYQGRIINFNDVHPVADPVVTRAELASVLVQTLNLPLVPACDTFPDVPRDAWYNQAVCTAFQNNLMYKYGDLFRPQDIQSRGQAALIIAYSYNVVYNCPLPQLFKDVPVEGTWYSQTVYELAAHSIFATETPFGSNFRPLDAITRSALTKWMSQAANLSAR